MRELISIDECEGCSALVESLTGEYPHLRTGNEADIIPKGGNPALCPNCDKELLGPPNIDKPDYYLSLYLEDGFKETSFQVFQKRLNELNNEITQSQYIRNLNTILYKEHDNSSYYYFINFLTEFSEWQKRN